MNKEEIVYLKVKDLKNNPKNPRKNDNAVESVAKSIEKYGFRNPLIVDENNIVWCGNTRLKASKKLGLKEVPCIVVRDLTEKQITELAILDNKTNEIAEWDFDLLEEILPNLELDEFELDWGVDEFLEEQKEVEEDNYEVPDEIEPRVKLGEIWQLGEHRLMCGDSTKEEDVAKLMDGEIADLLITDPPYNVDYVGKTEDKLKIKNDKMGDEKFLQFLTDAFACIKNNLKNGGSFYIWHADSEGFNFRYACKLNDLKIRECLIWNKNSMVMGRQDYQWKHEPCLYGWKDGASHYFIKDRTLTTVLDFKKPNKADLHPTMKPVELYSFQIKNSSRKNEIVLDTFAGSGTTVIACEQLNRKARVMELDEKYATVIIDRWEKLTGKKAIKIS